MKHRCHPRSSVSPCTRHTNSIFGRAAFTLIELLVVVVIIAILSAMTLGGLSGAAKSSRTQTTSLIIRALNEAIMTQYETYEDLALAVSGTTQLIALRARMREELPDAWADVADLVAPHRTSPALNVNTADYSLSRSYAAYKRARQDASKSYQSAECLYMIITQSGAFPDFLENIRPERIGDIDSDGAKEFLDGWGQPIAFMRWAPGFSLPLSPVQIADPSTQHDPIDNNALDPTAFALYPLIYSPGVDQEYGLLRAESGWPHNTSKPPNDPNQTFGTATGRSPCTFNPENDGLIGAPDPKSGSNYLDNITNHSLLAQ